MVSSADTMPTRTLFQRLEVFYDATPRDRARVEDFGALTLFVADRVPYPFYARPALGAKQTPAAGDLVQDCASGDGAFGVPEAFRVGAPTTPSLLATAKAAGLKVLRAPLFVLNPKRLPAAATRAVARVRLVDPEAMGFASDLGLQRSIARIGFGAAGTEVGAAGAKERDAGIEHMTDARIELDRTRARARRAAWVLVETEEGAVASGAIQRVGAVAELVGIATLPAMRRRGFGAAATAALAEDALATGADLVFLSAGSETIARVYERVGFAQGRDGLHRGAVGFDLVVGSALRRSRRARSHGHASDQLAGASEFANSRVPAPVACVLFVGLMTAPRIVSRPGSTARSLLAWGVALAAASIPCAPGIAFAGEPADLEALLEEPVVSTVSKTAETQSAAPATSTIISAEDLRRYGIRSLDDAINYLSLGMVAQNPLHSVDVGARGVLLTADFGNHVLLLVNGHAMNEQWDGTAYFERGAAIPFELIDHIEIIVGPGSVLYGSNAMLGVINVITKRAKDYQGLHFIVEGEVPTAFRVGVGAGYEFKLFGKHAEITTQVEYYGQKGPAFTFGPQNYGNDSVTGQPKRFTSDGPATGIWGGQATSSYYTQVPAAYVRAFVADFEVNARAAMYKRGTPYFNFFNTIPLDFNDGRDFELDRWISLDVKRRWTLSPIASVTTRLYGDTYDYQELAIVSAAEDCLPQQPNGCQRRLLGVSRWAGAEVQASFDWLENSRLVTMIGVDGRLRFIGSKDDITDRITGRERRIVRCLHARRARPRGLFAADGAARLLARPERGRAARLRPTLWKPRLAARGDRGRSLARRHGEGHLRGSLPRSDGLRELLRGSRSASPFRGVAARSHAIDRRHVRAARRRPTHARRRVPIVLARHGLTQHLELRRGHRGD